MWWFFLYTDHPSTERWEYQWMRLVISNCFWHSSCLQRCQISQNGNMRSSPTSTSSTWENIRNYNLKHVFFFWGGAIMDILNLFSTWVMNLLYISRPYTKGRNTNLQTKWLFMYVFFGGGIMCLQNCNNFTTSRKEICEIIYCNIYVMPWDHRGHHLKLLNMRNLGFLIVILLDWHIGDKFSQSRWQALIHLAACRRENIWAIAWAPSFSTRILWSPSTLPLANHVFHILQVSV